MKQLLRQWCCFPQDLSAKKKILFLDFDGTLSKIVKQPQEAKLEPRIRLLLRKVAKDRKFRIAIISGRALEDVKNKVGIRDIVYAGNHGLEIKGPGIKFSTPRLEKFRVTLKRLKKSLIRQLGGIKGVLIEDKGLTLSVHYRLVRKRGLAPFKAAFAGATAGYTAGKKIKIRPGKKVFEIRPPLLWDKGKVALWLLDRWKFSSKSDDSIVVYIGDDLTDEDAFRALAAKAVTAVVGRREDSAAGYYLNNVGEVAKFLKMLSCSRG